MLVALPLIHGPSAAKFNEKKPAKLRFFVGTEKDFEACQDEEESSADNEEVQSFGFLALGWGRMSGRDTRNERTTGTTI